MSPGDNTLLVGMSKTLGKMEKTLEVHGDRLEGIEHRLDRQDQTGRINAERYQRQLGRKEFLVRVGKWASGILVSAGVVAGILAAFGVLK